MSDEAADATGGAEPAVVNVGQAAGRGALSFQRSCGRISGPYT
jgi:hypothetical protein